ncbi:hypothetical protein ACFWBH_21335 [Streptomyces sp. NPDC059999]|uniref:hypothetical protein n=1 Tax=Streptomyces sp. NPDC059999 TaxID=3347030 RepID=UPI0036B036E1
MPGGGARERSAPAGYGPGDRYFTMRGREVFQHAVTRMTHEAAKRTTVGELVAVLHSKRTERDAL